jgi:hypothetical protein
MEPETDSHNRQTAPFCTKDGSEVKDTVILADYFAVCGVGVWTIPVERLAVLTGRPVDPDRRRRSRCYGLSFRCLPEVHEDRERHGREFQEPTENQL